MHLGANLGHLTSYVEPESFPREKASRLSLEDACL